MVVDGRIGAALCAAGAAVVVVAAHDAAGSRPAPVLWLLGAVVVAGGLGRLAGRAARWLAPAAVAGAVSVCVVPFLADAGEPTAAPLGYANADATFFVIGAVAGLALLVDAGAPVVARTVGAMGAAWLGIATVAAGSIAGLAVLVAAAAVAVVAVLRPPVAAVCAGLALAGFLAVTGLLAVADRGSPEGGDLSVRVALWHEALDLAIEHPLTGVGPGRYALEGPVTDDPDLRWAHHGPLQVAAELGSPGAALLLAAVGWALARGASSEGAAAAAALAATAALFAHASFDYVLHEGALAVAVAFLVGAATPAPGLGPGPDYG